MIKKTIEETRDWLLENRTNSCGDLDLDGLDFSEFKGDVWINYMKVKNNLSQSWQRVGKDLSQHSHVVNGVIRSHMIKDDEKWEDNKCMGFTVRVKILKEITLKELEEMGYKIKEEQNETTIIKY